MHLVLDGFVEHAKLNSDSVFLDIGSGLGRPALHAIIHSKIKKVSQLVITSSITSLNRFINPQSYGIECDPVKLQKAGPFMKSVASELSLPASSLPKLICSPIEKLPSVEETTHIYSAWEGFSVGAMEAVGKLFSAARSARAICIVQRSFRALEPEEAMLHLGFGPLRLVLQAPVFMSGSRRQLVAYMFVKVGDATRREGVRQIKLSAMDFFTSDQVITTLKNNAEDLNASKGNKRGRGLVEVKHTHGLRSRALDQKRGRWQDFDLS